MNTFCADSVSSTSDYQSGRGGSNPTSALQIREIDKSTAASILLRFHYLKDISRGFKSKKNYGLFRDESLIGVVIFTGIPVPELLVGCFGVGRNDQAGFWELSRLCLDPKEQGQQKNLASWFVSRTIRLLKRTEKVRAILSYADSQFHRGTVYQACNFAYYGLTQPKADYWLKQEDGTFLKHSRGKVKGLPGEWRARSAKHRYLMVFDSALNIKWVRQSFPKDS